MQPGDLLVLYLLLLAGAYALFRFLQKRWQATQQDHALPEPAPPGVVPTLLEKHGYEDVRLGKTWSAAVVVDGKEYESQVQIHYLAKRGEEWYVVLVASPCTSLRCCATWLRDRFFLYHILCQPAGVLYVEPVKERIHTIRLQGPGPTTMLHPPPAGGSPYFYLVALVVLLLWGLRSLI